MGKMQFFKFKINKTLWPIKLHYFLFNAGTGPLVPFLSTYARQLGFSSVIVGLIYTILPFAGMLAKPITGVIADRFKCQKIIFVGAQLVIAVSFLVLNFSPGVPVDRQVHFSCSSGEAAFDAVIDDACFVDTLKELNKELTCKFNCKFDHLAWEIVCKNWEATQFCYDTPESLKFVTHINSSRSESIQNSTYFLIKDVVVDGKEYHPDCPYGRHISTYCSIDCDNSIINDAIAKPAVRDSEAYGLYEFWIFLFFMITGWVGQAIAVSVGDAICFELLDDKPSDYGFQRLFGSLGWGLTSIISGIVVDAVSQGESQKNFAPAFFIAIAFLIMDVIVTCRMQNPQKNISSNIFKDVGELFKNVQIVVFLLWCIAVGLCTSLIWQFLFWLMEDLAKLQGCGSERWIKTLEGISMAIQTLGGELPFFFLSSWILRYIGHIYAMSLVLLVLGIRFVLYSVITDPWLFLPVEFLNGLTFGLFYACMASYASIVAPPGAETTVQGLVGAVFEGIGVSLGSMFAGEFYQRYDGPMTFRIFGIAALITCILHAVVQHIISAKDKGAQYSPAKQMSDMLQDDQQELTALSL